IVMAHRIARMSGTTHWSGRHSPEDQERFARAANDLVRNWMANGITRRAGLNSRMSGGNAVMKAAANATAPRAVNCFNEVASKLGAENTIEALIIRPPHDSLFPRRVLDAANARLNEFA